MRNAITVPVLVAAGLLALSACGSSTTAPTAGPPAASSAPATTAPAVPLSCTAVATLVADQRAQNNALQENWVNVVTGAPTTQGSDLQNAINATNNAPAGSAYAQLNQDASQFMSDQGGGLMPGWPAEYGAIEHDIAALASKCGISYQPPVGHTP